nr:thiol:disulfide interchange protein DsbA/DsbL [uncultured Steroidobacter sp.]
MIAARLWFVLFLSIAGSLSLTSAQAAPTQGTDYALITPPQPQTTAGKVEVIEFFSYGCPHCYHMNPLLTEWKKTQLPANAVLVKVPVSFGRREWGQLVRAYYTLESMGELERLDAKLFDAIHAAGEQLVDLDSLAGWAAKNGVDANKFRTEFNSPEITAKATRADQLSRDYKINGVPTLTVAGKYRALGKDYPDMLRITRELIDQAAAAN